VSCGSTRTVYLDLAGRQYVLGDDGRRVYGKWLLPHMTYPYTEELPRRG